VLHYIWKKNKQSIISIAIPTSSFRSTQQIYLSITTRRLAEDISVKQASLTALR